MNRYIYFLFIIFSGLYASPKEDFPISKYLVPIEVNEFNTGLDFIDCIYVINLDHRTDRWEKISTFFEKYNLGVNRVSAVNNWEFSKDDQAKITFPHGLRMSPGALGCLLSHVSVLKDAYDRNLSLIWILEDDAEFLEDPVSLIPIISTLFTIDPEWDLFYTNKGCEGWWIDSRPDQQSHSLEYYLTRENCNQDIMRIRSRIGTYSMILTRNGIKKLLDYFMSRPIWSPIDVDMHDTPGLREYSSKRDIVSHNLGEFSSDVAK